MMDTTTPGTKLMSFKIVFGFFTEVMFKLVKKK